MYTLSHLSIVHYCHYSVHISCPLRVFLSTSFGFLDLALLQRPVLVVAHDVGEQRLGAGEGVAEALVQRDD